MIKRLIWLPVVVLALALVVAGCGEDSSSASSIGKAQFIKKASVVCEEIDAKVQVDFGLFIEDHKTVTKPTEEDYAEMIDTVVVPSVEDEVDQIRAIGIPSDDEEQVEAILESREEAADEAVDDPKSFIDTNGGMFAESRELARKYGLKACAVS